MFRFLLSQYLSFAILHKLSIELDTVDRIISVSGYYTLTGYKEEIYI